MTTTDLAASSYQEFFLWLLGKRKRFRVQGNSMLPLLQPGEEILIDRHAYQNSLPQIGELVVAIHPEKSNLPIVKRVKAITPEGKYFLIGDNLAQSTDSNAFGAVSLEHILGKVTSRFG